MVGVQTSRNDAITSSEMRCMNLNYFHWREHIFVFLLKWVELLWLCFLLGLDCAGVVEGKEGLGKVRRTLRGSRGSLTWFHRSPQRSGARQPSLQASTGCLQGILQETQEFLQDVSKWDVWGWMVDGRCMDGYRGRMGVWSDLGTDGWSDEMICGRLIWL